MFSCLYKYWLKEFTKFFCVIQLIILVLFVIIDYLSRLDKFLKSDLSLFSAFGYVLLKVPFMCIQLTPASILLATITVFALMNRNNELLAIRSSGISVYYLMRPALLTGAVLSLLMFSFGETIVPVTMAKANYIKNYVLKKNRNIYSARKDIWIKSDNRLIHINYFDPVTKTIKGISITSIGKGFTLESRLDAKAAYYLNGKWVLVNIIEQNHPEDTSDYSVKNHDKKEVDFGVEPEDLGEISKKSNEMSFFELNDYVVKIEQEGYDARTYRVDLYGKIAFPFICIIMILTGAATGMRTFARNNLPVAIATGVVIAFFYWVMYGFCISLGYGNLLPPIVSAWTANIFFIFAGILNLINAE